MNCDMVDAIGVEGPVLKLKIASVEIKVECGGVSAKVATIT